MPPFRPTRADLLAAKNKTVKDVIAPGLKVLFCGINPGLYTAAIGHHFGRPGNRFWPALYAAASRRAFSPLREEAICSTSASASPTSSRAPPRRADELTDDELSPAAKRADREGREVQARASSPSSASAPTASPSTSERAASARSRRRRRDAAGFCPTPAASTPTTSPQTSPGVRRTARGGGVTLAFDQLAAILGRCRALACRIRALRSVGAATAETSQPTS